RARRRRHLRRGLRDLRHPGLQGHHQGPARAAGPRPQLTATVIAHNRVVLTRELPGDLDTPVGAYLKLANTPYTYLLESVQGGERFGRYSFIGLPSREVLRVHGRKAEVRRD